MKRIAALLITIFGMNDGFSQLENFDWAAQITGDRDQIFFATSTDNNGNIYSIGRFEEECDLNPEAGEQLVTSDGVNDCFMMKLNPQGEFIWARVIEIDAKLPTFRMVILDDDIFITMLNYQWIDIDPSENSVEFASDINAPQLLITSYATQNGNLLWYKEINSAGGISQVNIGLSPQSGLIVSGTFVGVTDLDPDLGVMEISSITGDVFVASYALNGDFEWAQVFEGLQFCTTQIDVIGNIYLSGRYHVVEDEIDLDPSGGEFMVLGIGGVVMKFGPDFETLWIKQFESPGSFTPRFIEIDEEGSIYTVGSFSDATDFNPSDGNGEVFMLEPLGIWGYSHYFLKLAANGDFTWVRTFYSEEGFSTMEGFKRDPNDNFILMGSFKESLVLNPQGDLLNLDAGFNSNMYVAVYNANGLLYSTFQIGNTDHDGGKSLSIDLNGNIFIAGDFSGTVDFDPGLEVFEMTAPDPNGLTETDGFIMRFDGLSIGMQEDVSDSPALFPNPCGDFIHLNWKGSQDYTISIRDASGAVVLQSQLSGPSVRFDMKTYAAGVYQALLTNGNTVVVRKFVKL